MSIQYVEVAVVFKKIKTIKLLYVKQLKEDLFYKLFELGKKFEIFILFIG